ncbi:MAG: TerB family tellurite resistance protein [Planctomycetota bacterium]|jgi:uncharacterized tellurite resistance protein B-like protein
MSTQDNINCLKNLMRLMCCDSRIDKKEKAFLGTAAKELSIQVEDWNGLLKEVLGDNIPFYPMQDRDKAIAALKAMIVMAKADGTVDEQEKQFALQFAKTIGVSKSEWKQVITDIDADSVFTPFRQPGGNLIAIREDFEKLDTFVTTAQEYNAVVQSLDLQAYLQTSADHIGTVCFHAAEDKDVSITRCDLLLSAAEQLVCVLNRYQGHQVKYLHEAGLKKCVIEPVYARDISDIFKT